MSLGSVFLVWALSSIMSLYARDAGLSNKFVEFAHTGALRRFSIHEFAYAGLVGLAATIAFSFVDTREIPFLLALLFVALADFKTLLVPFWGSIIVFVLAIAMSESPLSAFLMGLSIYIILYIYDFTCKMTNNQPGFGFGDALPIAAIFAAYGFKIGIVCVGFAAACILVFKSFSKRVPALPFVFIFILTLEIFSYMKNVSSVFEISL